MIKKNKLLERKNQLHEKKLNKGTHRMKERGGGGKMWVEKGNDGSKIREGQ